MKSYRQNFSRKQTVVQLILTALMLPVSLLLIVKYSIDLAQPESGTEKLVGLISWGLAFVLWLLLLIINLRRWKKINQNH